MPDNQPGTLEGLAIEIAKVFTPMKEQIENNQILLLLAELGLQFPDSLAADTAFVNAIQDVSTKITSFYPVIQALIADVRNGDYAGAVEQGATLIQNIITMVQDFQTIATEIDAHKPYPGITPADLQDFLTNLPVNLIDFLVVTYLQNNFPTFAAFFEFFGIIVETIENSGSTNPVKPEYTRRTLDLSRIPQFLTNPTNVAKDLYDWNTPAFTGDKLFKMLEKLLQSIGFPAVYDDSSGPMLDLLICQVKPRTDLDPKGIAFIFSEPIAAGFSQTLKEDLWTLEIDFNAAITVSDRVSAQPNGNITIDPISLSPLTGTAKLAWSAIDNVNHQPLTLIGDPTASRLQCQEIDTSLEVDFTWDGSKAAGIFTVEGAIKQGKLIVKSDNPDGFLAKILPPDGFEVDFDILIGWSSAKGFFFNGSSALEIALPLHIDLGPIGIEGLTVGFGFKDGKIPITLGADIKAELGPLTAVVQNIGVSFTFSFPPNRDGNLGPVQMDLGFKPPNGVGLAVDAGIIKGGGFLYLDFDKGEYYGALELEFQDLFSLKAVGLINTKLPDGTPGFSLLIIITADFTPIQLGFGFTLNGVGGLLGLNRTMEVDVLREGVKTNAIKSVLFPEDVVANISRIISDLKAIFPPFEGHFIVGPMAELGWAEIITLEIGILIEIPDPKIAILGVIKAILPDEDAPVLKIQINFLGVIDFDNKFISFDASLYDSNLLIFTLTGDMAFRLSWGDHPFFLLSVGGFHPAYKEAPADLQHMVRLGISLLANDYVKISVTCYFAVTSNTVQFGAKVELYAGSGSFNVYGYLGFDVLIQFDPFHFVADIYAGLALRSGTSVIMGISLSGELSGPKPWNVKGDASISILFFSISVHVDHTWGDSGDTGSQQKIDILALLTAAIADDSNWKADIPDNNSQHVSIKQIPVAAGELVIHPFGVLTFSERIVPLDLDIAKFGNDLPKDANHFQIANTDAGTTTSVTQEQFSPANFFNLTDAQKLSRNSFEPMDSGFRLTGSSALQTADVETEDVNYRITYLRKAKKKLVRAGIYKYAKAHFQSNLYAGAVSKSGLSYASNRVSVNAPDAVTVADGQYAIANTADLRIHDPALVTGSYTQALDKYNALLATQPALKGKLQIVSAHELNPN
jgi:hypothetical protein